MKNNYTLSDLEQAIGNPDIVNEIWDSTKDVKAYESVLRIIVVQILKK